MLGRTQWLIHPHNVGVQHDRLSKQRCGHTVLTLLKQPSSVKQSWCMAALAAHCHVDSLLLPLNTTRQTHFVSLPPPHYALCYGNKVV